MASKTSKTSKTGKKTAAAGDPSRTKTSTLRQLGIIGLDALEPIILAALATETPLLLIGAHGTAKSLLLSRLCEALGLSWRHYNASLVNYDDLIGYPLPNAAGELQFIQTPASVWGAAAVFIDEISRARPDMLNRLFPIVHERKVQGLPLPALRFRWAAMNPPASPDHPDESAYAGSEPLDAALADRFGFVVQVPGWSAMSEHDQLGVITAQSGPVPPEAARAVREAMQHIADRLSAVEHALGGAFAEYVRCVAQHAARLQLPLSGRRATMLYRNLIAVHAACNLAKPGVRPEDSSWRALVASLPQVACGVTVDHARLQLAHNAVWKTLDLERGDPRRLLAAEPDSVRRLLLAANYDQLGKQEFSSYAADALARLAPGARHAVALHLMESGAAARLIAAVAEQVAELFAEVAMAQNVQERVVSGSSEFQCWQEVLRVSASMDKHDPDRTLVENLLASQWAKRTIKIVPDVAEVLNAWKETRALCTGGTHAAAA